MKKRLLLHRETLIQLDAGNVAGALGGLARLHETFDSGETYCWCSQGCPPQSGTCPPPAETSGCNVY